MITVIIVTKNRPVELARCLNSIQQQTEPHHCIVVDGGTMAKAGITIQRNIGRAQVLDDTDIVVYCDDDTVLPPDTFSTVKQIFTDTNIVGLTGNMVGEPKFGLLKKLVGTFTGAYTSQPYGVSYGLFNIINPVTKQQQVRWLPGAFMCYRWSIVKHVAFDEWFEGYGLGEDFDFSYRVGSQGKLLADPDLKITHLHSTKNRDWEKFGAMRIINRNYLRKKFWPKSAARWLGMYWANSWLMLANGLRGVYSKRYRDEFIGEIKAIFTKNVRKGNS